MNFFAQQEKARKNTRFLVFLFILAVTAVVAAMNIAALASLGFLAGASDIDSGLSVSAISMTISGITLLVILAGSAIRMLSLGKGGGHIARQMGGERVTSGSSDPKLRRLYNVVEEMALASGLPVPQVYVIENESGINAFAAGHKPADAAVAVTRGCLNQLNRSELQGVIGHEFSHILNGDMRLNIRLIGLLAGITMLATMGRKVLYYGRYSGGSRRNNSAGAVLIIAITAMIVGWVGLFFARWIKAAVSRQREFLADASSVQFTRHPESLASALKKIGGFSERSTLKQHDAEEISHMLFAEGLFSPSKMFSTHPPLEERIKALDPHFNIRENIKKGQKQRSYEEAGIKSADIMGFAGTITDESLEAAEELREGIAHQLDGALDSPEQTRAMVFSLLLNKTQILRNAQLDIIELDWGVDIKSLTQAQVHTTSSFSVKQRHAALDRAVPVLNTQSPSSREKLLKTIDLLVRADGQITISEFSLSHMLSVYLNDNLAPDKKPHECQSTSRMDEISILFSVLAYAGHNENSERMFAYEKAAKESGWKLNKFAAPKNWVHILKRTLPQLDCLSIVNKEKLLKGMIASVSHDGTITAEEYDLMRVFCASVHIPLPLA